MKPVFIVLLTSVFFLFGWRHKNISLTTGASSKIPLTHGNGDSSQAIRIINGSSLKRLPGVVRDLSLALKNSDFNGGTILDKNGFAVYLYDVTCNSFENSAAVRYHVNDTIYHVKLNRFNRLATDDALAATLIHELMHCVLLDLFNDARKGNEKSIATIESFGFNRLDSSNSLNNEFFKLMNRGDEGQHELIYRIFYPRMVSLLIGFAELHKNAFSNHKGAEQLMWSGLQETSAYKKLSAEERREIGFAILKAKGVATIEDY
jgi:hypothetical protein